MAEFISISSVEHVEEAAIIAEIQAILSGEFNLPEIPFDRDLLSASFIEKQTKEGVATDEIAYLEQEPQTCFQDARSNMEGDITTHLTEYAKLLGVHFPFDISGKKSSTLKRKDGISPIGIAYIWLKIYILSVSDHDYIQFDDSAGTPKESIIFNKAFRKVFEYLAAFAVSGKYGNTVWMTAASRSATDYLGIIQELCNHTKQGTLKTLDELSENQRLTNDGRHDAILITTPNEVVRADSEIYLVQATIQKSNLKEKVVTQDNITFFNNFFIRQLDFAKRGVLVVPHKYKLLDNNECGTKNCVYIPRARIFENLGQVNLAGKINDIGDQFIEAYSNIEEQISYQRLNSL